jgi:hypothetical protein
MVLSLFHCFTRVLIENPQPTFIVAGGVRCATGWIRECLSEHPEVYMQPKETHYFDKNYEKGSEWYGQFFRDHISKKIFGEKTASYLHNEQVASHINKSLPNVKLIFCLRDPVERMYSHYSMSASNDEVLREMGFLQTVEHKPKFLEWGKYCQQLTPFLSRIPNDNILIKIYEDIEQDPYAFISDIYNFIGANPYFKAPSTLMRTKPGQLEHNSSFWGSLSKIMLHPRAPFFFRSFYTSIRPDENRKKITEKVYRRFSAYYQDDILQLEELLGRDLTLWRTKRNVMK